jgi:2-succinyl-6-hydroxy-2,4-cyclohexadiene-1-carboxylate synthase
MMTSAAIEHIRVRDQVTLRVVVVGVGPPVLLLHGFMGSADTWGERILATLARTHRVLAVDLPGHGGSDAPADPGRYALEVVIRDLAHLLSELGAPRADWVGYSMGGRIALGAAVLAPERVSRLVLEGATAGLESDAERRERRESDEVLARRLEHEGLEAFLDDWAAQPLMATQRRLPQTVRAAERERRLRNRPEALAACLRGLGTGTQPPLWHRLGEVRGSVLLVTGEEDQKFTALARRMTTLLPRAQHVLVPSVGHAVHLEAPEAWLEAVTPGLSASTQPQSEASG